MEIKLEKGEYFGVGTIIGDMFGSRYEFNKKEKFSLKNYKLNHDPLFCFRLGDLKKYSDNTVMTMAVKDTILQYKQDKEKDFKELLINSILFYRKKHLFSGYGREVLYKIINNKNPLGIWGDNSLMRVSPIAWTYKFSDPCDMKEIIDLTKKTVEITHTSKEGVTGAMVLSAITGFLIKGDSREIAVEKTKVLFPDLKLTSYSLIAQSKENIKNMSVVEKALACVMASDSFEESILRAVTLQYNSSAITATTGAIAEAYFGLPYYIMDYVFCNLTRDLAEMARLDVI